MKISSLGKMLLAGSLTMGALQSVQANSCDNVKTNGAAPFAGTMFSDRKCGERCFGQEKIGCEYNADGEVKAVRYRLIEALGSNTGNCKYSSDRYKPGQIVIESPTLIDAITCPLVYPNPKEKSSPDYHYTRKTITHTLQSRETPYHTCQIMTAQIGGDIQSCLAANRGKTKAGQQMKYTH